MKIELYVSPQGLGNGEENNPCSIEQVQNLARGSIKGKHDDIEIILSGGEYTLNNTLTLTPEDAGTENRKVTWRAAENEHPVLSSRAYASNFKLHDESRNIWMTDITHGDANFTFEHLWSENGKTLTRAWSGLKNKHLKKTTKGIQVSQEFGVSPKDFRNAEDVVMVGRHFWYYLTEYNHTATESEFIWDKITLKAHRNPPMSKNVIGLLGYYSTNILYPQKTVAIENAYEFLTDPGEWYFDRKLKKLYIIPLGKFDKKTLLSR